MIQSADQLADLLRGTVFENRPIRPTWLSETAQPAFVIDLEKADAAEEMNQLGMLRPQTGLYPVMTKPDHLATFCSDEPPEPDTGEDCWTTVSQAASRVDGAAHLAARGASEFSPLRSNDLPDWLAEPPERRANLLARTMRRFGKAPTFELLAQLLEAGTLQSDADFERWMLHWEIEHFGEAALAPDSTRYLEGSELGFGPPPVVILLPVSQPWQALLYLGWNGLGRGRNEQAAVLRSWEERYGAELTRSFNTTLHVRVRKRPQSADEALDLAIEHYLFAPDTLILPTISLRDHARSLLSLDRWYFHDRP